jgi:hypothetical protein
VPIWIFPVVEQHGNAPFDGQGSTDRAEGARSFH